MGWPSCPPDWPICLSMRPCGPPSGCSTRPWPSKSISCSWPATFCGRRRPARGGWSIWSNNSSGCRRTTYRSIGRPAGSTPPRAGPTFCICPPMCIWRAAGGSSIGSSKRKAACGPKSWGPLPAPSLRSNRPIFAHRARPSRLPWRMAAWRLPSPRARGFTIGPWGAAIAAGCSAPPCRWSTIRERRKDAPPPKQARTAARWFRSKTHTRCGPDSSPPTSFAGTAKRSSSKATWIGSISSG